MSREDWEKNPIHMVLQRANLWPFRNSDIRTVLDVACGLSLKSRFLNCPIVVGVDIHEPYLRAIDYQKPHVVIKHDVRFLGDIMIEDSFDVVYAIDILEHVTKKESEKLIEDCKRIAKKAVIIETPNGYVPQNIDIQGFNADKYQTHRCHWEVDQLRQRGFKCVVRQYKMQDIKRHTKIQVCPDIELIDGIFIKEKV